MYKRQGIVRIVDQSTLVPDENLSIDEGAVAPWQTLMWSLMKDIAREMGVRTHVPFKDLTARERDIVFHGPAVKKHIVYQNKTSGAAGDMDFTYFNATYTVENALSKVKDEKGMKRVEKFLRQDVCPDCGGTRLSEEMCIRDRIRYGSHFPYEKMIGRTVPVSYAEKRYKTGIPQRFYDLGCVFFLSLIHI